MGQITALVAMSLTVMFVGSNACSACETKVRDAAFRTLRDVHQLCVMGHGDDARTQSIFDALSARLRESKDELNIEVEMVDVDDPDIAWSHYGIPSAPPGLPVVVLVGHNLGNGEYFVIDHWEPAPTDEEFAALIRSPVRDELANELVKRLAVLLYVPGDDPEDNRVRELIRQTKARWDLSNELGLSVLEMDRSNYDERTLLSFAGISPDGEDWVGVIFGRGKLMAPPLVGEDITSERLNELLGELEGDCSCSKPLPSMGVDIPLAWNESRDAAVVVMADDSEVPIAPDPVTEAVVLTSVTEKADEGGAFQTPLVRTAAWTVSGLCLVVLAFSIMMRRHG